MTTNRKNIYFASDFHLGTDGSLTSIEREKRIVEWLLTIEADCKILFLVGDVFDYWFEYRNSIPKGYTRLFAQFRRMVDQGIEIHFFVGNHDMWVRDYFTKEFGIKVYYEPATFTFDNQTFYIGHGDGLGPGDIKYKVTKKVLRNPFLQWLFGWIHPSIGLSLMRLLSKKSRDGQAEDPIIDIKQEWLVQFCENHIKTNRVDCFIFGHRHLPIDYTLSNHKSRYINLGDWLEFCSYGVWNGQDMSLLFYKNDNNHEVYKFT